MRLRRNKSEFPIHISQLDLLFCSVVFLAVIVMVLMKLIDTKEMKEEKKEEKVFLVVEAKLSISMTWSRGPEDIDLWAIGPDGRAVGYQNTRSESLGYLRDDTGLNQWATDDDQESNYELITAHGFVPGHYVVNVHYFAVHNGRPNVEVKVKILLKKKSEGTEVIYNDTVKLIHEKQEKTVLQFDLLADGSVEGKSIEPKSIFQSLENRQ